MFAKAFVDSLVDFYAENIFYTTYLKTVLQTLKNKQVTDHMLKYRACSY